MAAGLARKAGQEARLLAGVREVEARGHEAKAQLVALAPKVRRSAALKAYCCCGCVGWVLSGESSWLAAWRRLCRMWAGGFAVARCHQLGTHARHGDMVAYEQRRASIASCMRACCRQVHAVHAVLYTQHCHYACVRKRLHYLLMFCQVSELVERTRGIKAKVESAVSAMFNGRKVNVMGEINNVLASSTI